MVEQCVKLYLAQPPEGTAATGGQFESCVKSKRELKE